MAIEGYSRSTTANEPRPNDIVSFNPGLSGWTYNSFTGKDIKYINSTSTSTQILLQLDGIFAVNTYYGKGIVFIDEVHYHEIIPAGSSWIYHVWAKETSDLANCSESIDGAIFVWRGATDSVKEIIGTFTHTLDGVIAYTELTGTETNASDIVLYPGDRICIEFYAHVRVFIATGALSKWNITMQFNNTAVPTRLDYPPIKQFKRKNELIQGINYI